MNGKVFKNYVIGMIAVVLVLSGSLLISDRCDAKVYYCDSHDTPKNLEGEFIAVYDMEDDKTVYYDSEEIDKLPLKVHKSLEPKQPAWYKEMGQFGNILAEQNDKLLPDKNSLLANPLSTSIVDNRIKVPDLHTYPFYSTAKVFVTYPSSPGVRYIASAYEIHNNLCATAGHVILDTNGESMSFSLTK